MTFQLSYFTNYDENEPELVRAFEPFELELNDELLKTARSWLNDDMSPKGAFWDLCSTLFAKLAHDGGSVSDDNKIFTDTIGGVFWWLGCHSYEDDFAVEFVELKDSCSADIFPYKQIAESKV